MDKAKKKLLKRYLLWAALACLVLLLTVMPLLAKNEAEADGPQASILSATVEKGSITTSLRGGGNLQDQDEADVVIPTGVKITGFLVKNGDIVTEGTPLAEVDKVSVMAAISSVNDTMTFLREELEKGRDEQVDEVITAVPGGRVKKIFAKEGETVQEVMLRDGCLAVLSIDSMMAVSIETPSELATGENVDVTLADGTTVTGRVESNLDGKVVVTVEDEGYEVGQTVTVEGLGTDILYIHNAWKATAYAGTISKIQAKEEDTVKAGEKLFTLSDRDFAGQLQHRANQHREYEKLLQTLLKMYQSGTIDAPCDGLVSGVDTDSVHLLSSDGAYQVELLAATGEPAYRIVFLSETKQLCTGLADCQAEEHTAENHACIHAAELGKCPAAEHEDTCIESCTPYGPVCNAKVHQPGCIVYCGGTANPGDCSNRDVTGNHKPDCIRKCTNAGKNETCQGGKNHYPSCIESCNYNSVTKTCPGMGAHKDNCIRSCVRADYIGVCKPGSNGPHYADCIESCIVSESVNQECPAAKHKDGCHYKGMTYTAYVAVVDYVGSSELGIYKDAGTQYTVEKWGNGWAIVSPKLNMDLMITKDKVMVPNAKDFQKNDIILLVTAQKDGKVEKEFVVLYQKSLIGDTDLGDLIGGLGGSLGGFDISGLLGGMDLSAMLGGFAGFGNFGGLPAEDTENLHDLEGSTLLTVTPHKTMKMTITLDEQDIAKIATGMAAKVKVEALRGQEFLAQVTKVSITGTNSGGSSKFTAELTLDAALDMLPGMSATAAIDLETKENILTLPVAAVWEVDGKTVVYTALDKETKEPANPVEVVTGLSDGERVEILSGLSEGDQVYYEYYDTLEENTSAKADRFTFG